MAARPRYLKVAGARSAGLVLLVVYLAVAVRFAYPYAPSFEPLRPETEVRTAATLLLASVALAFAYCRVRLRPQAWIDVLLGGLVASAMITALDSWAEHELVLVSFRGLFCPAGAALGAATALTWRRGAS